MLFDFENLLVQLVAVVIWIEALLSSPSQKDRRWPDPNFEAAPKWRALTSSISVSAATARRTTLPACCIQLFHEPFSSTAYEPIAWRHIDVPLFEGMAGIGLD